MIICKSFVDILELEVGLSSNGGFQALTFSSSTNFIAKQFYFVWHSLSIWWVNFIFEKALMEIKRLTEVVNKPIMNNGKLCTLGSVHKRRQQKTRFYLNSPASDIFYERFLLRPSFHKNQCFLLIQEGIIYSIASRLGVNCSWPIFCLSLRVQHFGSIQNCQANPKDCVSIDIPIVFINPHSKTLAH